jgi:hypothetical protein
MFSVIRPLVEEDFNQTTAGQNTNREIDGQVVDSFNLQPKSTTYSLEPKKNGEEPQRITQTIEPQVESRNLSEDGINSMDERSVHCSYVTQLDSWQWQEELATE